MVALVRSTLVRARSMRALAHNKLELVGSTLALARSKLLGRNSTRSVCSAIREYLGLPKLD